MVKAGLVFGYWLFLDNDQKEQIARAIWNVPYTIRVCDFLTKPHYDLVANKNEMAKSLHIDIMDMDRDVEYIMLEIFTMELTSTS